MKFIEFNLHENILKGIDDAGFISCTPCQEETLKRTLNNKDVCVQSQTGTGKTAAFLITIFEIFLRKIEQGEKPKALIIAPTRELAIQIEEEAKLLGKNLNLKTACFYGGVSYAKQEMQISNGIDIFIGTPGRLIDFIKSKKLNFRDLSILVLDEADRMFDMGFFPDIRFIMHKLPPKEKRMTLLFSATLAYRVRNLAWEYMNFPDEIDIKSESVTVTDIEQKLFHVGSSEKFRLLLGILKHEKPRNLIIFANTKHKVAELSQRLQLNGYPNDYITGDLPQKQRIKIINNIKSGTIEYLIATDVAARGLHIDNLDLVINYDIPEDAENYVHRIGRTARAGNKGRAYSLACEQYVLHLEDIENMINQKIPVQWVEDDYLVEDKTKGIRLSDPTKRKNNDSKQGGKSKFSTKKPEKKEFRKKENFVQKEAPVKTEKKSSYKEKTNIKTPKEKQQRVKRAASTEQRLEYYKQKYGEDFKIAENGKSQKKNKISILGSIKSFFGKKKK
ncbi:MAG: DEAD/DEAH box helicase [Spirochaetes bacterium]|nr:DEAD/DEAH box helicase [Spirochaetota bacterium]